MLTFCINTKSKSEFGAEAHISDLAKVEYIIRYFDELTHSENHQLFLYYKKFQIFI